MSKESKLEKKEAKAAKKSAKAEKAAQKAAVKADKKHEKEYNKFVKSANKKNEKGASKEGFVPIVIPPIDEYQSKREIKLEKATDKAYAAYFNKIEKKNAKLEAKCAKQGTPFVPLAVPTREEFMIQDSKGKKIFGMIILLLLIALVIYFLVMWLLYTPLTLPTEKETESTTGEKVYDYDPYQNMHEITTTPDYSVADATDFLRQVIHDNYKTIGYSSDVSNGTISYTGKKQVVNNANSYIFTCSGKTFAVPVKLSGCYVLEDGKYVPLTFNNTDYLW